MSTFDDFTNQYELSKTLRFELKPVGNTQQMLVDNNVFQKDELIQKKYKQTKIYLDKLHREFATEALRDKKLPNLEQYSKALKNVRKISRETDKKQKDAWSKELENQEKRLRKEIVNIFNAKAKEWSEKYPGLKNKDLKILDEEAVFSALLKVRYENEPKTSIEVDKLNKKTGEITKEKESIFDEWKGFTGYFTKFFETRKNFYKDDGTSTALATRIVDQNLRRFAENIETIGFIQRNHSNFSFTGIIQEYGFSIDDICNLDFYASHCLLQTGIDNYNKKFVGKIKSLINEYRQKNKVKIPYLKTLDKQILSEKEKFIDEIENDIRLKSVLEELLQKGTEKTKILKILFSKFVNSQTDFNLSKIYWSKKGFETISRRWTYKTSDWEEVLAKVFKEEERKTLKQKEGGGFPFPDFIPLAYLKKSLEKLSTEELFWKEKYQEASNPQQDIWNQFLQIFKLEFFELFNKTIQTDKGKKDIGYDVSAEKLQNLLKSEKLERTQKMKEIVKDFADNLLSIYQFSKYFAVEKSKKWDDSVDTDDNFYSHFKDEFYHDTFDKIIQPYNLLRNYLTKKPWEEVRKWKLNFDNSSLLTGWPDSPEGNTQYGSFIFQKDKKYFLGITDFSRLFDKIRFPDAYKADTGSYKKMVYKQVDAKTLYGSVYKGLFGSKYSEDQKLLKNTELIQRIKKVLETRLHFFPAFQEFIDKINKNQYQDAKSLAREISKGSFYNVSFVSVSDSYVEKGIYHIPKNKKGDTTKRKLYLFQIKNKDWNEGSTGRKNLHTLYFENLFSKENIAKNFIIKLNGQAEVFYRPKAIEAKKVKRNFKREIIEKKRYTENKIFFHVPLALNRGKGKPFSFNKEINAFLANNPDINIIGVDRGEKHLAYYSVINQKGEILKSDTLNVINDIDYHEKLEKKAGDREQARKDWQTVEEIKDLKKGYISQVVKKLADLAIEHNAIIVFEDLNMRFKQIRGGIEKSVYQQLEKALIEKLSFLVNKNEKSYEKAGHLLRAHQLATPIEAFKDMGKQTGIIFYTTASYTSKIDPVTGWRPNLYLKYNSATKAKEDILRFSKTELNNGRFEFTYDIEEFIPNAKEYPKKTKWTLCSCVERFKWNRKSNNNKGGYDYYENLTKNFQKIFESVEIDVSSNILEQINKIEVKGNEKFFRDFIFFWNLLCQIRNTDKDQKGNDNDFILSPVDPFFDSRKDNGSNLPKNGDDNGAYNIARKGLIMLNRIDEWADENKKKYPDLFVSNTDWDNFVQKKSE